MSDDFSARLNLPYLAAGQMQKHVTLNTALTQLDALLQTAVVSRTTAIQPTDASDGDLYILPGEAEGAVWAGRPAGTLMRFEGGGWTTVTTPDGMIACVLDEGVVVVRAHAGWIALGQRLGEVQGLTRLGLGTTADDANPLAAKINAALFTARGEGEGGDGDLRLTLNKATAGDVLSLLFQSGYAARAELGLIGDGDLRLKACDDAGTWRSVWRVDRATGRIGFDQGAVRRETTLFTSDDDYALPAWARWVEATCVGGGGGGGAGLAGPSGAPRLGGGGGGAGGLSLGRWSTDDLDGVLSVTVGAGGISGVSGGDSEVAMGGAVLLRATGGTAGGSGVGGAGGIGQRPANPGGSSLTTATATMGSETLCSDGPGGGGAGGGLSAADIAYAGGAGGVGGWSGLRAAGGVAGAAGQASPKPLLSIVGGGGGGGDASASGAGSPGGAGAHFGGGGGGGGGGAGLTFGGQGGSGASGAVLITVVG